MLILAPEGRQTFSVCVWTICHAWKLLARLWSGGFFDVFSSWRFLEHAQKSTNERHVSGLVTTAVKHLCPNDVKYFLKICEVSKVKNINNWQLLKKNRENPDFGTIRFDEFFSGFKNSEIFSSTNPTSIWRVFFSIPNKAFQHSRMNQFYCWDLTTTQNVMIYEWFQHS